MDKWVIKRPRSPSARNQVHIQAQAPTLNSAADDNSVADDNISPSGSGSLPENLAAGSGSLPENPAVEKAGMDFNPNDIISDLGDRIPIDSYNANIRDQVRRAYLFKGAYQPSNYTFPKQ